MSEQTTAQRRWLRVTAKTDGVGSSRTGTCLKQAQVEGGLPAGSLPLNGEGSIVVMALVFDIRLNHFIGDIATTVCEPWR